MADKKQITVSVSSEVEEMFNALQEGRYSGWSKDEMITDIIRKGLDSLAD